MQGDMLLQSETSFNKDIIHNTTRHSGTCSQSRPSVDWFRVDKLYAALPPCVKEMKG